ncbi:MAG: hypothetical protein KDA68_12825 [Planctomycetaceae bacterium]|nr:hypothetical protein [Planctomycetaceae bacterium]
MKFHEIVPMVYHLMRNGELDKNENQFRIIQQIIQEYETAGQLEWVTEWVLEYEWLREGRPYYNLYPFVAENLVRTKLDVPGDQFVESMKVFPHVIQVRLPENNELKIGTKIIRGFLAQRLKMEPDADGKSSDGVFILVDVGETVERFSNGNKWFAPVYNKVCVPLTEHTVFEEFESLEFHELVGDDKKVTEVCLKLYIALSMLADDTELVKPDVLSADRAKYENARTDEQRQIIVERARRRGKTGWVIGEGIEFSPHIRRSHFAIRWMGHGDDKRPVLRFVKAAVVKRKSITDIPTGYLDDEEET